MCSQVNENYFGHLSFLGNNLPYYRVSAGERNLALSRFPLGDKLDLAKVLSLFTRLRRFWIEKINTSLGWFLQNH